MPKDIYLLNMFPDYEPPEALQDALSQAAIVAADLDATMGSIHVAAHAPTYIPKRLMDQTAKAISTSDAKPVEKDDTLISFDDCVNEQVIEELKAVDINTLSPYEAMSFLFGLQKKLK